MLDGYKGKHRPIFNNVCVSVLRQFSPRTGGMMGGQPRGAELVHFQTLQISTI